ncbi:MAG: DUF1573 domain-containing protein [Bacteroidales bacterium]|nr:DUF1573 domain-containing protein [Bacteroidales bacterium]
MKRLLSLLGVVLVSAIAMAQKPVMTFETDSHDFGDVQEKEGKVTYIFNYTNTGGSPLVLSQVQASCGCTTPEWTRTPVRPQEKGTIKVTFDPTGRPGKFSKTITVQSNAQQPVKTLRITGNVLQKPRTIEDDYPVLMDGLRLENNHMAFTRIAPEESKQVELKVVNTSDKDLTPEFINVPSHITVECQPATLKPNEKGLVVAKFDATKKQDWGFVSDYLYVIFDGKREYKNRITLSASIEEDFSKMTEEQMANAPVITFNEKSHNFGDIPQTNKVETDFVVTNEGNEQLIIRKVKASCGCTAVTPQKTVLEKGESTNIHVAFDPHGKNGRQSKTITVISNDPKSTNIILKISCNVLTPGANVMK